MLRKKHQENVVCVTSSEGEKKPQEGGG